MRQIWNNSFFTQLIKFLFNNVLLHFDYWKIRLWYEKEEIFDISFININFH
jgi:hypothetical protein